MKQENGREGSGQLSAATIMMGRSLLLASSGAVRRLHHETIVVRIKKWLLAVSRA